MNTNTIHSTVKKWAEETDERIHVALAWTSSNWEIMAQTQVTLQILGKMTGDKPYLGILIPHARRTPLYFYGPNEDQLVEEDYHLPSFEDEVDLRIALSIVYRRFMTEHGMQRFDDFKETVPKIYRPNLVDKANEWVFQKISPKYSLREFDNSLAGSCERGVELHPVGKNPSGLFIRITADRTKPQKCVHDKSGKSVLCNLPAFFTESELLGAIEYASRYIDTTNKKVPKKKP